MTTTDDMLSLYRVDSQLRGLRTRVDNATRTLRVRETQLADLKQQREELESNIRQLSATAGNLEGESNDIRDRIEKLRVELNAATTDKQYQAILAEMKIIQEQRDEVDSKSLIEMERVEALQAQAGELDNKIEERTKVRDLAITEQATREEEVSERVQALQVERDAAASVMSEESLAIFDRVAEDTEGETLAPVVEINKKRREYACGMCNVEIPYHLVAELHAANSAIQQCPACTRILYLEPAEAAEA